METIKIVTLTEQKTYEPTIEVFNGEQYIVVPVVMMVEGVHNGSRGAIYHSPAEFSKNLNDWKNVPVTIHHPVNEQGEYVSANSENILSSWGVGHIDSAYVEDGKLKAKAWLNIQKLTIISPQTLESVRNNEIMEVSIGIFSEEEDVKGTWKDEQYNAVARNYRPDHLALLPGEIGACSIQDGCGIRVNKKKGGNDVITDVFKQLNEKEMRVSPIVNEVSFSEITEQLYNLVNSKDSETEHFYVEDIFDSYIVYKKRKLQRDADGGVVNSEIAGTYKQAYQIDAADKVSFVGDAVEVKKEVSYITLQQDRKRTKFKKEEVNVMCEPCKKKADALINHAQTHFTETDREWLEALTEDKLDKLIPKLNTNSQKPAEITAEQAWEVLGINKEQYEKGVEIYNKQRTDVVAEILANTENVWEEADLKEMKLETLQKIAKSSKKPEVKEDYSGMGAGVGMNANAEESDTPYIPGIEFSENK